MLIHYNRSLGSTLIVSREKGSRLLCFAYLDSFLYASFLYNTSCPVRPGCFCSKLEVIGCGFPLSLLAHNSI